MVPPASYDDRENVENPLRLSRKGDVSLFPLNKKRQVKWILDTTDSALLCYRRDYCKNKGYAISIRVIIKNIGLVLLLIPE